MSSVDIQAQRDLSIAGDVVGRDKITINITRGLDELPTRYDSRVVRHEVVEVIVLRKKFSDKTWCSVTNTL